MERVDEHFDGDPDAPLSPRWTETKPGGSVRIAESCLWLAVDETVPGRYCDAQIDDYTGRRLRDFPWRPPLRLHVRARASHGSANRPAPADTGSGDGLTGTAGFGFWNYPATITGVPKRSPDAVWFLYASPPSNMALVPGSPGHGWKAQVVHAHRWGALAAVAPMALAAGWSLLSGRDRTASRWLQRMTGASEVSLDVDLREWHDYTIDWLPESARFAVDGNAVLAVDNPPRGPLGFVAWVDNQYAVATPRGQLHFGKLASGPEWLALDLLRIEPL